MLYTLVLYSDDVRTAVFCTALGPIGQQGCVSKKEGRNENNVATTCVHFLFFEFFYNIFFYFFGHAYCVVASFFFSFSPCMPRGFVCESVSP